MTGVQTCALPIFLTFHSSFTRLSRSHRGLILVTVLSRNRQSSPKRLCPAYQQHSSQLSADPSTTTPEGLHAGPMGAHGSIRRRCQSSKHKVADITGNVPQDVKRLAGTTPAPIRHQDAMTPSALERPSSLCEWRRDQTHGRSIDWLSASW